MTPHTLSTSAVTALAVAFLISSCASPESKTGLATDTLPAPKSGPMKNSAADPSTDLAEAPPASGFMPACLNVVENDLRVEFDKSQLILKDGGKAKALSLDNGEQVKCEKLTILTKTKRPSVEIVYLTRETGTSINIIERRMAIASIKNGTWIAKPLVIDRLFTEDGEIKTVPVMNVKWSEDKGALVLTRTDIASKESETIKP